MADVPTSLVGENGIAGRKKSLLGEKCIVLTMTQFIQKIIYDDAPKVKVGHPTKQYPAVKVQLQMGIAKEQVDILNHDGFKVRSLPFQSVAQPILSVAQPILLVAQPLLPVAQPILLVVQPILPVVQPILCSIRIRLKSAQLINTSKNLTQNQLLYSVCVIRPLYLTNRRGREHIYRLFHND